MPCCLIIVPVLPPPPCVILHHRLARSHFPTVPLMPSTTCALRRKGAQPSLARAGKERALALLASALERQLSKTKQPIKSQRWPRWAEFRVCELVVSYKKQPDGEASCLVFRMSSCTVHRLLFLRLSGKDRCVFLSSLCVLSVSPRSL